jgi:hypothetical protein
MKSTAFGAYPADSTPRMHAGRLTRIVALGSTAVIMTVAVASWLVDWDLVVAQWGSDRDFFVSTASRWLATGQFYHPRQLSGPYDVVINVDTLYPPSALLLFTPFVWLPAALWWVVPLAIIGWSIVRSRPPVWIWPFLALMIWWPRSQSIVIWGSTGMWVAASVALAIRFRWFGAFILLKPSLIPFALMGIRARSWWVVACAIGVLSVPLLSDYITAMRNNTGSAAVFVYSIQDIPFIALPLIAWMASRATWARERAKEDSDVAGQRAAGQVASVHL